MKKVENSQLCNIKNSVTSFSFFVSLSEVKWVSYVSLL